MTEMFPLLVSKQKKHNTAFTRINTDNAWVETALID